MNGEINTLLNTVIKNDFCVGCGVYAYSTNSLLTMKLNDVGKYVPYIEKQIEIEDNSAHVCCDYCDDVLAETADISIGDAWLPEYVKDSYGTNIIIVRNPFLLKIIENNKKELKINELSVRKVYLSQAGGFRHRREGLSYRLFLLDKNNEWRPHKRIKANSNISSRRKRIYDMRLMLREQSYIGFKKALDNDDFRAFEESMTPFIEKYNKLSSNSITKKVLAKIQSIFN